MLSTVYERLRLSAHHVRMTAHPRALAWQWKRRTAPHTPIAASIGDGLRVRVYPGDVIGKEIYVRGGFEAAETRFVQRFLKPGMVFVDGGANLGYYTVLAASLVGASGAVHSFEPSGRMFKELCANVELNGLGARCTLNNLALAESEGTAKLSRYPAGAEVYGSISTQTSGQPTNIGYETVTVTTLDRYAADHQIARIDLIKLDIEGAELLALRGANRILSSDRAPAILIEMADVNTRGFGYQAVDIFDFLTGLGYRFHSIERTGELRELEARPDGFAEGMDLVARRVDARAAS